MSTKTFVYFSTFAGFPLQHETNLTKTFAFGISTHPFELPDPSTPFGTHFRSLQPLSDAEAASRLIGKLREKATDAATMPALQLSTLANGLHGLLVSRAQILALPGVLEALQGTIGVINAVMAVPPAPAVEVVETAQAWGLRGQVAALETTMASLARANAALIVRVAALEAQAS